MNLPYDDDFGLSESMEPSSANGRWILGGLLALVVVLLGWKAINRSDIAQPDFAQGELEPQLAVGPGTLISGQLVGQATEAVLQGPRMVTPRGNMDDDELATIGLFRKCSKSVVFITTIVQGVNRLTMNPVEIPSGTGTGFVWDRDGHVVTNYHVVEGTEKRSQRVKVVLSDQTAWPAELVGKAPNRDIAVLKLDAPPEKLASLQPIVVGSSNDLIVGQNVYAIGNPFGFDQTLTTGVISGLEREIRGRNDQKIEGLIQTDAAINPGNSGGPLLDSAGRLIGVNTAIYSPSGAYAGIGFAIPIDNVNRLVPRLIYRKVAGPALGIVLLPGRQLGINGVIVREVAPGGTADVAGIRPTKISREGDVDLGDVIIGVDGVRVNTTEDLYDFLDAHQVGDEITISVVRDAESDPKRLELPAKLQRQSSNN